MRLFTPAQFERFLANQIDEVGNHSSLLMWTLGNEMQLELPDRQDLLPLVNRYIGYARLLKYNEERISEESRFNSCLFF